jgi:hypothetical protein
MLVDPGNVGFALDGQIVLRWRFFFQAFFLACRAPLGKRRDIPQGETGSDWTQLGMIIGRKSYQVGDADMPARSRGATRPS